MPAFGSPIPYAEPLWYSNDLSPYYNESHRRLRKFMRDYVNEHVIPNCEQWEREAYVPPVVHSLRPLSSTLTPLSLYLQPIATEKLVYRADKLVIGKAKAC